MRDFLRRGVQQHVPILGGGRTVAPGLEEVLQADPDFSLDATDRLLELPREQRVRRGDPYGILQAFVMIIHSRSPSLSGGAPLPGRTRMICAQLREALSRLPHRGHIFGSVASLDSHDGSECLA